MAIKICVCLVTLLGKFHEDKAFYFIASYVFINYCGYRQISKLLSSASPLTGKLLQGTIAIYVRQFKYANTMPILFYA